MKAEVQDGPLFACHAQHRVAEVTSPPGTRRILLSWHVTTHTTSIRIGGQADRVHARLYIAVQVPVAYQGMHRYGQGELATQYIEKACGLHSYSALDCVVCYCTGRSRSHSGPAVLIVVLGSRTHLLPS